MRLASDVQSGAFGSAIATQSLMGTQREPPDSREQMTETLTTSPSVDMKTLHDEASAEQLSVPARASSASAPHRDAEIEALIERIKENVSIKDVPIKASQWVQVPKGYLMDLELQPSQFFKFRADFKTQVKKRKREASLPKWTCRRWQNKIRGFRPEEVNWNGAVCMDECQPSNLTNKIHPLFDRSCFDDTPDVIYDQLIPALQLASLFLTTPICMQFWVTLAMGKRTVDPEMSAINGKLSQRIANHVELTAERARSVIKHLDMIGRSKLIHYRFHRQLQTLENTNVEGNAYAVSMPICDYKGIDTECHGVDGRVVRSIIRFHADYYIVAKKLSQLKFQEVSQKLRFSFGFAVLIVHELAHSVEGIHFRERDHQWLDWQSSNYYREPYWLDWHESECGRAWEETMFGGQIQPINRKVDGSHGIATADWPFGGRDEDPQNYRWWTVSMKYIEHMFQMSTWRRSFKLTDWRIFNIPRDGATSLYINSFSTMNPSEEERVAKEELADLVAQSSEEPATKKRVMALGETEERRPDEEEVIEHAVVDQEKAAADAHVKRQVPMFPGTRRLSSVMSGPLPDIAHHSNVVSRPILKPHTRKASPGAPVFVCNQQKPQASNKSASTITLDLPPHANNRSASSKSGFVDEQRQKDLKRLVDGKAAEKRIVARHANGKRPTSELIKTIKPKPRGILDRYKHKKKAERVRQRTVLIERREIVPNRLERESESTADADDLEPPQQELEESDETIADMDDTKPFGQDLPEAGNQHDETDEPAETEIGVEDSEQQAIGDREESRELDDAMVKE